MLSELYRGMSGQMARQGLLSFFRKEIRPGTALKNIEAKMQSQFGLSFGPNVEVDQVELDMVPPAKDGVIPPFEEGTLLFHFVAPDPSGRGTISN